MTNATATDELEPPRQEADMYGEPVAEYGTDEEYWEAYNPSTFEPSDPAYATDNAHLLFVAHYIREDGEWVKDGLDRHHVKNLFNFDGWPTN